MISFTQHLISKIKSIYVLIIPYLLLSIIIAKELARGNYIWAIVLSLIVSVLFFIIMDPAIGLIIVIFLTPLELLQHISIGPSVIKMTFAKLCALLTLIIWIFQLLLRRNLKFVVMELHRNLKIGHTDIFFDLPVLLLSFVFAISLMWSKNYDRGIQDVINLCLLTGMYILVVNLFRKKIFILLGIAALFFGAFVCSSIGIYEWYFGSRLTGQPFNLYKGMPRVSGTYSGPAGLGALLGMVMPLALSFFLYIKSCKLRVALGFVILVYSICSVYTITRAAWGAILIGCIYVLSKYHNKLVSILGIISIVLSISLIPHAIIDRASYEKIRQSDDDQGRIKCLKAGTQIFKKHFLLGLGVGSYNIEIIRYYPEEGNVSPHNDLLRIATETGLLGLIIYVWIIIITIKRLRRKLKTTTSACDIALVRGCCGSLLGYLFFSQVSGAFFNNIVWLVFSMAMIPEFNVPEEIIPSEQEHNENHR